MRSSTFDLVLLTVLAAVIVYSTMDAWLGSNGALQISPLRAEISQQERDKAALEARRAMLEQRVCALKGCNGAVDVELADERFRAVLGVAHRDDVLLTPPPEKSR